MLHVFRQWFLFLSISLVGAVVLLGWQWPSVHWAWLVLAPLLLLGLYDLLQTKHTILRLYPLIGHFRYMFESVRNEMQQYFVESDTDGMPISREFRSLAYQRAKQVNDTRAYGTIFEVYRDGYEWLNHSLAPTDCNKDDLRVQFGGAACTQPYSASPLNISAMSFGALSRNAVMALNRGAKLGGFAHNTGEGGLSPWHLKHGGGLIWQIGTGYFGCRNPQGEFDAGLFAESARRDEVKMIELKLSQGAKPGHGSELSGGKPVGFKLCVGDKREFLSICKAMRETGIVPDFITLDGAEGGTGAAPVELTNSVGMPLRGGLHFVHNALLGIGARDQLRIIAAGKVFSAFHMLRAMALGADTINSARGMMLALGCIQSRRCNTDKCPTGITTQNPSRYKQLDVTDKGVRVANYHHATIQALMDLLNILGLRGLEEVRPRYINRRSSQEVVMSYEQIYPCIPDRCLLDDATVHDDWKKDWESASAASWR